MVRILCLFVFLQLFIFHAQGQFFVAKDQPCVFGGKVTLDTIFYTPDKALPFDRCFYLSFKLPGNVKVDKFTILPVNQYGEKSVRRRDYRVFLKSGWRGDKKAGKAAMSWTDFKNPENKMLRLFEDIVSVPGANGTELILKVSPLDPNRLYQLILLNEDQVSQGKLKIVSDLILKSASSGALTASEFDVALTTYQKILEDRSSAKPSFRVYSFEDFIRNIYDCPQLVKLPKGNSSGIEKITNRHRKSVQDFTEKYFFYLVPAGQPFDSTSVQALSPDRYLLISTENGLDSLPLLPLTGRMQKESVNDINGNPVNYFGSGSYDLYALKMERLEVHHKAIKSYTKPAKFDKIASFSFIADPSAKTMKISQTFPAIPANSGCDNTDITDYLTLKQFEQSIAAVANLPITCFAANDIHYVMNQALLCPCEEMGVKDITQRDELLRVISFFHGPISPQINLLQKGLISLKDPLNTIKEINYEGRISNIKTSIIQVQNLREFISKVKTAGTSNQVANMQALLTCLDTLGNRLITLQELHQNASKNIKRQLAFYRDSLNMLTAATLANGSSAVLDFVSANKFRIIPDFGLIVLFKGSDGASVQDLSPYLGFHINFRSIDKSIEMKHVPYKSWRHYFSVMAGITLRSLKIEGKREDFFGNNCLISGLGYRFNNFLRLTGGLVWFRTIDKNPLSTDKPLGFSPFVGLSLDLELQDLFGGIKNLFK